MKITPTNIEWKLSKRQVKCFDMETLEDTLKVYNNACGGRFYIVDYIREKIIVDSSDATILCGYSRELLKQEGFGFFDKILKQDESE